MNIVFSSPMFFVIVGAWLLSLWYVRYMKKYEKEGSFVGSAEPKLLLLVTSGLLLAAVITGFIKG